MKTTDSTPEQLLARNEVDAFVVTVYEDERPLQGLAFRLNWRLCGVLAQYCEKGIITGQEGECTLLPIVPSHTADQRSYKLIVVGGGKSPSSKDNSKHHLPASSSEILKKNILKLGIQKVGVSKSDLGTSIEALTKNSKGVEIWVTP